MAQEERDDDLWSKYEWLRQENKQLKAMMRVLQENEELRSSIKSFNFALEELTASETKPSLQQQKTVDENQFRKDLQPNKAESEHRTSSPVDFTSFIQSSMQTDAKEQAQPQACHSDTCPGVKGLSKVIGEIAYQLDRRILSHVFQGQKRLYGFTVLNIPQKIIEVSTHPLTGKVDEGYRLYLSQRYSDLMATLQPLGYKASLHPPFTEFVVNTFGILKQRPADYRERDAHFQDVDFLKRAIVNATPSQLHKDLLILLTCLCSMAERDGKTLFFW